MLKKNRGYKYRLKPNNSQKIYLEKAFGCCRKMYNIYVDLLYTQLEQLNFVSGKIDYKSIELPTPATHFIVTFNYVNEDGKKYTSGYYVSGTKLDGKWYINGFGTGL